MSMMCNLIKDEISKTNYLSNFIFDDISHNKGGFIVTLFKDKYSKE